jgi:hypothetical protein
MHWLARTRFLLWLAVAATVPPAVLDLADATWPPLAFLAGIIGFPYYAAQAILSMPRVGTAPGLAEVVGSAALGALPFLVAHWLMSKRYGRNAHVGAPAA